MSVHFLRQALAVAWEGRGFCSPNPAVGALVVKDNQIIGRGCHRKAGGPHAEVVAIQEAQVNHDLQGATLYVTLEPCAHQGKTPPCTDLIIHHQFARVIYCETDCNRAVKGAGADRLREAGISCEQHSCVEITEFYQSYRYFCATRLPYVTAKLAMSLDGKIALPGGTCTQITAEGCAQFTHQHRLKTDVILSSAQTVIADNPQLNVRLDGQISKKPVALLDRRLSLPLDSRVLHSSESLLVFHTDEAPPQKREALQEIGVECLEMRVFEYQLSNVIHHLGALGYHDVWCEAGGRLFSALVKEKIARRAYIYMSLRTLGQAALSGLIEPELLSHYHSVNWQQCGDDVVATINLFRED